MNVRPQLLQTITYPASATGGTFDEPLDAVQARNGKDVNYLAGVMLRYSWSIASGVTSDAIGQYQFAAMQPQLELIDVNDQSWSDQPLSLAAYQEITQYLRRSGPVQPAAIAANSNQTNTGQMICVIPFWLPFLKDPGLHLEPSAFLKRIRGTWAANTIFGTGQTINVATTLEVYALHLAKPTLQVGPRLAYGAFQPRSFLQGRVPLHGRALFVGAADDAAGATTTLGATDFTDYQLDGMNMPTRREDIDVPAHVYNAFGSLSGDGDSAQLSLPTSGSARSIPLYLHGQDAKMSELPLEKEPAIDLIVGAGGPALGDQSIVYAVSRERDVVREREFASAVGASKDFHGTPEGIKQGLIQSPLVEGRNGGIPLTHPLAPFLRRRVNLAAVTQVCGRS